MTWIPPLSVVETWPAQNLVNPESQGPGVTILNAILVALSCFIVGLRVYTRVYVSHSFGWDDALIVIALFPAIGFTASTLYALINCGVSYHLWDIPYHEVEPALRAVLAAETCFMAACGFNKISMLALVRRITKQSDGPVPSIAVGVMIFTALAVSAIFFATIFQCDPVSDIWTFTFNPAHCADQAKLLLAGGVINTFLDFVIVLLPIPVVLKLDISRRQQFVIMALFGAGFVVCIAGITRTYYTYRATVSRDSSWDGYAVFLTSTIELYIGIIGASIPPTRPFFRRYYPRVIGKITSTVRSTNKRDTVSSHALIEEGNQVGQMQLQDYKRSSTPAKVAVDDNQAYLPPYGSHRRWSDPVVQGSEDEEKRQEIDR